MRDFDTIHSGHAEVEHATAKDLIEQLEGYDGENEKDDAKFTVLAEYIRHHVKEEEGGMFSQVKKARKLDLQDVGAQLKQRKEELMSEMGVDPMEAEEEPRKRASPQPARIAAKRR